MPQPCKNKKIPTSSHQIIFRKQSGLPIGKTRLLTSPLIRLINVFPYFLFSIEKKKLGSRVYAYVYAFAGACRQAHACPSTCVHVPPQASRCIGTGCKHACTPPHEGIKKGAQAPWFFTVPFASPSILRTILLKTCPAVF
jgi:hypothetical protein